MNRDADFMVRRFKKGVALRQVRGSWFPDLSGQASFVVEVSAYGGC